MNWFEELGRAVAENFSIKEGSPIEILPGTIWIEKGFPIEHLPGTVSVKEGKETITIEALRTKETTHV